MEIVILYGCVLGIILCGALVYGKWREQAYKEKLGLDRPPDKRAHLRRAPYERGIYEVMRDWWKKRRQRG